MQSTRNQEVGPRAAAAMTAETSATRLGVPFFAEYLAGRIRDGITRANAPAIYPCPDCGQRIEGGMKPCGRRGVITRSTTHRGRGR